MDDEHVRSARHEIGRARSRREGLTRRRSAGVGHVLDALAGLRADGLALFGPLPRREVLGIALDGDTDRREGCAHVGPALIANAHRYEYVVRGEDPLLRKSAGEAD